MKTSLWIVVVLVSGIVGFLVGYSVSTGTGTRGLEAVEAGGQQPAAPAAQPAPAPAAPAGGYAEKSAAPAPAAPAGGYGEKPAATAQPAAAPAAPKKVAPRRAPEKRSATTGGY